MVFDAVVVIDSFDVGRESIGDQDGVNDAVRIECVDIEAGVCYELPKRGQSGLEGDLDDVYPIIRECDAIDAAL
jgi:hypothetical protein